MPRHVPVLLLCASAFSCVFVLPLAPVSAADGIHVDPGSAPAAEYGLPLQAAREQARGPARADAPAPSAPPATAAPAFGAGISSPSARASTRPGFGRPSEGLADALDGDARTSILFSVGPAIAVLLAGAGLALTLRRRSRPG